MAGSWRGRLVEAFLRQALQTYMTEPSVPSAHVACVKLRVSSQPGTRHKKFNMGGPLPMTARPPNPSGADLNVVREWQAVCRPFPKSAGRTGCPTVPTRRTGVRVNLQGAGAGRVQQQQSRVAGGPCHFKAFLPMYFSFPRTPHTRTCTWISNNPSGA